MIIIQREKNIKVKWKRDMVKNSVRKISDLKEAYSVKVDFKIRASLKMPYQGQDNIKWCKSSTPKFIVTLKT